MDPALKRRLDERLVSGELTPDDYQAILKTLTESEHRSDVVASERAPDELKTKEIRSLSQNEEPEGDGEHEFNAYPSSCPKCGAQLKKGVTYCNKCDRRLNPEPAFQVNGRAIAVYFTIGFVTMRAGHAFNEGLIIRLVKIALWPIFVLKGCVS